MPARIAQGGFNDSDKSNSIGLRVSELTADRAKAMGLPENTRGVIVSSVDQGSAAASAGIRTGDVIRKVGTRTIQDTKSFSGAFASAEAGDEIPMVIQRGDDSPFLVFVQIPKE